MKYIDLNNDTARQIIVDKEDNQYLGQVSSVMFEDERTILATYPKGHGKGSIIMKKSYDGGLTWSERMSLPESFVTSLEVPTIYRMKDPNGKERIILFSGSFPIRYAISEDNGNTWTELEPLDDFGGICAMGDVIDLKTPGKYMALFHDDSNAIYGGDLSERRSFWRYTKDGKKKYMLYIQNKQEDGTFGEFAKSFFVDGDPSVPSENGEEIYATCYGKFDLGTQFHINTLITKDGGITWSQPQTIARHPSGFLCEPAAIRLKDDTIAILMRENTRKLNSFIMFSDDNGETFSKPRELPLALTGDRHVCRRLHDGRIAITFRENCTNQEIGGDWVLWIGTDEDLLNGTDGQYKFRLKDNLPDNYGWGGDSSYAGFHVLPDDTMVLITYGRWEKNTDNYILSVRLNLKEFE